MGRVKYSTVVTGVVYANKSLRWQEGFKFEVKLPYKDLSEDSLPIHESNGLIFSAINQKDGTDFFEMDTI